MNRKFGSKSNGGSFSEAEKLSVWNKAATIAGEDPTKKRKDICGAWIYWDKYGETITNGNGWEIDHIKPVSKGGTDDLINLQPLQWQNNRNKGNDYPASNYCIVTSKL